MIITYEYPVIDKYLFIAADTHSNNHNISCVYPLYVTTPMSKISVSIFNLRKRKKLKAIQSLYQTPGQVQYALL